MKEVARIGLVGAGWWACQFHIPHLLENKNVELVAISRLGKEELKDIQSKFQIEHGAENHSEIYKHI
jgi:predicted dehydrogenase